MEFLRDTPQKRDGTSEMTLEDIQRLRGFAATPASTLAKARALVPQKVLAIREKSRAEHAQRAPNYKGAVTWDNGLNPHVTDPEKFLYIPPTFDNTLVVLGYGLTYVTYEDVPELECLATSRCSTVKAVKVWLPNSALADFSPECSDNKTGNLRSRKGGLTKLHGNAGAENERMFLINTLEFVQGGGRLILLTSAINVTDSTVWENVPDEVKNRVIQVCHPCSCEKRFDGTRELRQVDGPVAH
jgi:hypothetical protein